MVFNSIEIMRFQIFSRASRAHGKGIGRIGLIAGLLVLVNLVALRLIDPSPVELFRHQVFDLYQRIEPAQIDDVPVVIVDIDEASLETIGQWPWPRPIITDIVKNLAIAGAVVIGFDVIFAERDRVSPPALADEIANIDAEVRDYLRRLPDNDGTFADIIGRTRTVLAQAGSNNEKGLVDRPAPKKTSIAEIGGDPRNFLYAYGGITRNIPVLEDAAHGLGMINLAAESDGIIRRVPLALNVGGTVVPTLGVEMLRLATEQSTIGVRSDDAGINSIVLAGMKIPTDKHGEVWVRFAPAYSVPYVPAKDVLDGTVDPAEIAGKFVLIGTSAVGLLDIKTTPVASFMPGVEAHAQFLANVLKQDLLSRPAFLLATEVSVTVVASIIILLLTPRLSAAATLFFGGGIMIVLAGVSWYLYTAQGILFDVTATAITTFMIYALLTYVKYVREEADKKMVRRTFSQYLAPAVVDQLAENPDQLKLGGENREMTILFSDIRGFTSISERIGAEELTTLINRILTPLTEAILEKGGTVDKYIGDCLMAFWNAPYRRPRSACQATACLAALDMIRQVKDGQRMPYPRRRPIDSEEPGFQTRLKSASAIGLNSGVVLCRQHRLGAAVRLFRARRFGQPVVPSRGPDERFMACPIVLGETTAAAADRHRRHGRRSTGCRSKGRAATGRDIRPWSATNTLAAEPQVPANSRPMHDGVHGKAYFGQEWEAAPRTKVKQPARALAEPMNFGLPLDHFYEICSKSGSRLVPRSQDLPAPIGMGSSWRSRSKLRILECVPRAIRPRFLDSRELSAHPYMRGLVGRLAQRESAAFTRQRSQVQSLQRPPILSKDYMPS